MATLITLEEYKDVNAIMGTKDDSRITILVDSASQLVKTYCNRTFLDFYATDKVQAFNLSHKTDSLQLMEFPILEVVSVEERNSYQEGYKILTEAAYQFYIDAETDSIIRTAGSSGFSSWALGPGSVRVTYKGGFASTPADLKLAVFDLVTYYHKNEYKAQKTIAGSTLTNKTTSSQANQATFPDHIKRVLDLYRVR